MIHLLRFLVLMMTFSSATAFQVSLARFYQHTTADLGFDCNLGRGAFSRHINLAGLDILHLGRFGEVPNIVQFGFSNPAGLRNKGEIAVGLGPGVWSFSETHLSQVTQRICACRMPAWLIFRDWILIW